METQVATLQAQLTDLALQLLQERELRTQQLLLAQQALFPLPREQALASLAGAALSMPIQPAIPSFAAHPTEHYSRTFQTQLLRES
jgi:hypothetical protein